jgi:choline dehydrogenase-like flavoprotein
MNVRLESGSLAALAAPASYDVCIIGSGPAGTLLGTRLAGAGVRTLILESGRGLVAWLSDRRLRSLAEYEYTLRVPFSRLLFIVFPARQFQA